MGDLPISLILHLEFEPSVMIFGQAFWPLADGQVAPSELAIGDNCGYKGMAAIKQRDVVTRTVTHEMEVCPNIDQLESQRKRNALTASYST